MRRPQVFVIADTHFYHSNIIKYCKRPFTTVEEMNDAIIKNWNSVVCKNDIVIHLGDVALCSRIKLQEIVSKLNGRKFLIKGNHDTFSDQVYRDAGFEFVSKFPIIYKNFFIMSHEPLQLTETTPYFNLYGHVHNDSKFVDNETSKCVSVERIDYTPYKILEL